MEKCILAALDTGARRLGDEENSLDELASLVTTAGGEAVGRVVQRRNAPDPATYFGKGKVREIRELAAREGASTLVVDGDLRPTQEAELARLTGLKVIERTTVILDIFAQHARTAEGKLQVRVAQLQYRLGRLVGGGTSLSRLGGGIGTRGPGEQKLEEDRRRIRQQISRLSRQLQRLDRTRTQNRKRRQRSGIPVVALVGYANAGKSTLLHSLTGAEVPVEDKLFSTLDPRTGRTYLPEWKQSLLVTDTVGFVRDLPPELVSAFKATLDEVLGARLLVHVVDISRKDAAFQARAVREILHDIGATHIPELLALNKTDKLDGLPGWGKDEGPASANLERFLQASGSSGLPYVLVSARQGDGLAELKRAMASLVFGDQPDRASLAESDASATCSGLPAHAEPQTGQITGSGLPAATQAS